MGHGESPNMKERSYLDDRSNNNGGMMAYIIYHLAITKSLLRNITDRGWNGYTLASWRHRILYNSIQFHMIPCDSIHFHTFPYNSIYFHTIPCDSIYFHDQPPSSWGFQRADFDPGAFKAVPRCGPLWIHGRHYPMTILMGWSMGVSSSSCGYPHSSLDGLFHVKSHRSKWMMTGVMTLF